jgi:hypothetical protein
MATKTETITTPGTSYTAADITAKLNSLVTLRTQVDAAKAATRAKLAAEKARSRVPPRWRHGRGGREGHGNARGAAHDGHAAAEGGQG